MEMQLVKSTEGKRDKDKTAQELMNVAIDCPELRPSILEILNGAVNHVIAESVGDFAIPPSKIQCTTSKPPLAYSIKELVTIAFFTPGLRNTIYNYLKLTKDFVDKLVKTSKKNAQAVQSQVWQDIPQTPKSYLYSVTPIQEPSQTNTSTPSIKWSLQQGTPTPSEASWLQNSTPTQSTTPAQIQTSSNGREILKFAAGSAPNVTITRNYYSNCTIKNKHYNK